MFPDTDAKYKGANSLKLLEAVVARLNENGFAVGNIDCTIIAQSPKMKPYISAMRQNIASACNVNVSFVNVKATTEEWLGFTGREEGISAHAVALVNEINN
jgi:2-C-methyl-D-erythritol 2,4-cyclodiphosphate synthase